MSDSEEEEPKEQKAYKSYLPCPICEERQRTDSMKSHLYCQHAKKNVQRWVSKEVLAEAIAKKIPMIWRITKPLKNESYENINWRKKVGDFCICLVCKDSRYYKPCNIKSDLPAFFRNHLKAVCMSKWNSVAARYGEVVTEGDNPLEENPKVEFIDEERVAARLLIEDQARQIAKLTEKLNLAEAKALDFECRWGQLVERLRTG